MIRSMDTAYLPVTTTEQGSTRETPYDKPDHVRQKHDIAPQLKTDGDGIQEQKAASLSSRTITDLNPQSAPYPETRFYDYAHMDNNPRRNYSARHANVPGTAEPKTAQIGNQKLMTLDTSQSFVDPTQEADREYLEIFNFSLLVDFLHKNSEIKYIVDIGCGNAKISLLMQNYLDELEFQIKVIPVDIANTYSRSYAVFFNKPLPINIIPAQEIADATPATTLFTVLHSFTGTSSEEEKLSGEIVRGETEYYITTLIKNNPGCFVLATEDPYASSPQLYIPPELVYTKHYYAIPNCTSQADYETKSLRQAKAAEMNAENGDIDRLNQFLAKLPEQRSHYLAATSAITERLQGQRDLNPGLFTPDYIFDSYLWGKESDDKAIRSRDHIKSVLKNCGLELRCWHVYRQDVSASEASSQANKSN
ncbi:hypothetical protein [Endozoicomonas sp. ONNA1]|uniref:hypothetical protein n=1 Tax=Endozoicomonas sp. ONNA1 TaxID=2828740 RepID=UPI00214998AF|nr:hypothetical protein [Endozoicomonas sp. ONNA1]